jgi:DNA-binding XRE family transcriptional regulator
MTEVGGRRSEVGSRKPEVGKAIAESRQTVFTQEKENPCPSVLIGGSHNINRRVTEDAEPPFIK